MLTAFKITNYESNKLHWNGSRDNCNGTRFDLVWMETILSYISCISREQYGKKRQEVIFIVDNVLDMASAELIT